MVKQDYLNPRTSRTERDAYPRESILMQMLLQDDNTFLSRPGILPLPKRLRARHTTSLTFEDVWNMVQWTNRLYLQGVIDLLYYLRAILEYAHKFLTTRFTFDPWTQADRAWRGLPTHYLPPNSQLYYLWLWIHDDTMRRWYNFDRGIMMTRAQISPTVGMHFPPTGEQFWHRHCFACMRFRPVPKDVFKGYYY
jgi:hypothetical protein